MGNYCCLEIIDKNNKDKVILELDSWKNNVPKQNDVFNLIFNENEFVHSVNQSMDDEDEITCLYLAQVSDVISRLNILGLDSETIIKDIAKYLGVNEHEAQIALCNDEDPDDVADAYKEFCLSKNISLYTEDREEYTDDFIKYTEMHEKLDLVGIDNLKRVYYYYCILKNYDAKNYYLRLNFAQILSMGLSVNYCKDIILPEKSQKIELNKEYLFMAKKHFSEQHYDLVYIELIIILERALKNHIAHNRKNDIYSSEDLEKLFIDLSLMNLLRFSLYYLSTSKITEEEFEKIQKIYNIRNNTIHSSQKRFSKQDCSNAIRIIEKLLGELEIIS